MKSEERGFCGVCEEEYEPFMIIFEKDALVFAEFKNLKDRYGWICPDCLEEEMFSQRFAVV